MTRQTSVCLNKCHDLLGLRHGSGHVLQVGDVGQGRCHLQEQVRSEPGARHHPQLCELEPVRLSELISRHPVQMFLIELIHSLLCVTFNSVKVCRCFSPQTQHPRHCLQEQNIYLDAWKYFLI